MKDYNRTQSGDDLDDEMDDTQITCSNEEL